MIYPKKIKAKESNRLIKLLLITSILMAIMIKIINIITTPNIPWAELTIAGIIYTWITVIYSIRRNINIAGHVLLQTILVSIFTVYIDYEFGFKGWSINIAIPLSSSLLITLPTA